MTGPTESNDSDDFIGNIQRRDAERAALERAKATGQQPRRRTNAGKAGGYAAQALSDEIDNVRNASVGTRNDTLNTAAFNLGMLIGAGELDRTLVEDSLRFAARSVGLPDKEIELVLRKDDGGISKGMAKPRDMSDKGKRESTYTSTDYVPPPPPVVLDFNSIEDGFWTARKSLEDIYLAALSRMCAPWSVLACCAARALAQVRPHIVLPELIGDAGSLNWFGAITASSGGGKGAASATAKVLVPQQVITKNTGSGEGMIAAYRRPATDDDPPGLHEAIMFMVDEIDSLTAQSSRSGATTMSVLRSAFSGETLGFSYINKNTPTLDAHSYRMTMIISVQPQRAATLLADHHGGTPQRFMWLPGTDKRITVDMAGGYVVPLTLPRPGEWTYPTTIQIPKEARDFILRERVKAMNGDLAALDGHALFMREKFAFALAVLDGRTSVSLEDWELSGIAAKVSDNTRDWVIALAGEAEVDDATKKGKLQAVSSLASDAEKFDRTSRDRARVMVLVRKYLTAVGAKGMTKRDVQRKLAADGPKAMDTLSALVEEGFARYDQEEKRWYTTL